MVQKACLVVIDGWGISAETRGNAVSNASTPSMEALSKMASQPLSAHGLSVGLPVGLMGNSEVGHLNIGAGRIVYQDIVRIELAISHNSLCAQPAVKDAFHAAKLNGQIHLAGLVSDGGVHSHISHLLVLLQGAKDAGITNAYVHVFGDGRDVAPKSIKIYLEMLQTWMDENNYGSVATITGRYYAMDRDKRWERVKAAYDGMCHGVGEKTQDYMATIDKRYEGGETDEFFKPIICDPAGSIKNGHVVLCFNFRSDRMREISQAFIAPPFETQAVTGLNVTTMTVYKAEFPFPTIFPPQTMSNCLGEWLAAQKIPQVHIAETEKVICADLVCPCHLLFQRWQRRAV